MFAATKKSAGKGVRIWELHARMLPHVIELICSISFFHFITQFIPSSRTTDASTSQEPLRTIMTSFLL